MSKTVRPLTVAERKSPASSMFVGGFKNVAFQVGKIELPNHVENVGQAVPSLYSASLVKSERVHYPLKVPTSVRVLKNISSVVCNVVGQPNQYGDHDAFLLVRNVENLSSFSIALRNIKDVIAAGVVKDDEEDRLGKGQAARAHNQVKLSGLVVGTWFEDGENPRFHIKLRQTADSANIIPLVYQAKNASGQVGRVKIGNLITVEGEYAIQRRPVYKMADGVVLRDENQQPIVETGEDGEPLLRTGSYIRILSPKDVDLAFDTNFVRKDDSIEFPSWAREWSDQAIARSQRVAPAGVEKEIPDPSSQGARGEIAPQGAAQGDDDPTAGM